MTRLHNTNNVNNARKLRHNMTKEERHLCYNHKHKMAKQKLWVKKRTTRGSGRKASPARVSAKNLDRDLRKNQTIYSHYLLKFVAVFLIGLLWFRLGVAIGPLTTLPVGMLIGLLIVCLEKTDRSQKIELCLVLVATIMSYLLPIGIVI